MTRGPGASQSAGPAAAGGTNAAAGPTVGSNVRDPDVNVSELTDRVYRLLLADLEIQRKRLHGTRR